MATVGAEHSIRDDAGVTMVRDLLASYADAADIQSVAVIGNAPLTPDGARAEAIDACDLVIRVNSFVLDVPTTEPAQGKKVHAVVYSRGLLATPFCFDRYRERLYLVTEPSRIYYRRQLARHVKEWPGWWPRDLGFVAVPNGPFAIPLLDELGVPWREQFVVPTTGTMAAFIARKCFPDARIVMAGFSMIDNPNQSKWQHQWGDWAPIGGAHLIVPEGRLLHRWIDEGKVQFLR